MGWGRSDELDKTALETRLLHAATLARGRSARWGQWIFVHLSDYATMRSYMPLWYPMIILHHSCESCIIQSLYKDTSLATPAEALEVRGTLWASHSLFIKPWHQRALCRWVGRLASPSRQPFCAVIESSPSVAYNDIHRLLCMNSHSPRKNLRCSGGIISKGDGEMRSNTEDVFNIV